MGGGGGNPLDDAKKQFESFTQDPIKAIQDHLQNQVNNTTGSINQITQPVGQQLNSALEPLLKDGMDRFGNDFSRNVGNINTFGDWVYNTLKKGTTELTGELDGTNKGREQTYQNKAKQDAADALQKQLDDERNRAMNSDLAGSNAALGARKTADALGSRVNGFKYNSPLGEEKDFLGLR